MIEKLYNQYGVNEIVTKENTLDILIQYNPNQS